MAASSVEGDKYKSHLSGEGERNTQWRYGAPPNYDVVNKLFEEGRTKIWPPGSLEEKVQNLVKTWEMEMFHKTCFDDYKTVDPKKYRLSLNGRKGISLEELRSLGGGYNSLLQTSLPDKFRCYNPAEETVDSAHKAFTTAGFHDSFSSRFCSGDSPSLLGSTSDRINIGDVNIFICDNFHFFLRENLRDLKDLGNLPVYKFSHWAFMEGPFKVNAPTGEMVEFYGMSIFELDEHSKIVRVEFFYDRGELLGGLMKGKAGDDSASEMSSSCPFLNTG